MTLLYSGLTKMPLSQKMQKRREEFKLADIYTEEGYNNFTSMSYLLYNTSFYTGACIGICQEVIFGPDLLVSSFMQYQVSGWFKGSGWGVSLLQPAASFTLLEYMKIWCNIQVIIYRFLSYLNLPRGIIILASFINKNMM